MSERAYTDMGAEHSHHHRNSWGNFLRIGYSAVVLEIQSGWIFLQRVTKNMLDAFAGVVNIPRENFLPRLFFRKSKSLTPIVGTLGMMPVKKSGIGLLNPML